MKTIERISNLTRNEVIKLIKQGLEKRSGKKWSVTGGTGSAYGWLSINCPPNRRTYTRTPENTWVNDPSAKYGYAGPADRAELANLLGNPCGITCTHHQGHSVPSSTAYYAEFVDRAEGRTPETFGTIYWD